MLVIFTISLSSSAMPQLLEVGIQQVERFHFLVDELRAEVLGLVSVFGSSLRDGMSRMISSHVLSGCSAMADLLEPTHSFIVRERLQSRHVS